MKAATRREFDLVASWSVDRLGRSLQHLVQLFADLKALNVGLYLHQQHVDSTTSAGRALLQISGVFAEFERAMIQERIRAGAGQGQGRGQAARPAPRAGWLPMPPSSSCASREWASSPSAGSSAAALAASGP
jgi:DNA invertase Pin-like site-specific DNA recombinase